MGLEPSSGQRRKAATGPGVLGRRQWKHAIRFELLAAVIENYDRKTGANRFELTPGQQTFGKDGLNR